MSGSREWLWHTRLGAAGVEYLWPIRFTFVHNTRIFEFFDQGFLAPLETETLAYNEATLRVSPY
jgi:hypothetical protein